VIKRFSKIVSSLLLVSNVYAGADFNATPGFIKVVTISGGPAWSQPGENQLYIPNVQPASYDYSRYIPKKETQTIGTGEIFFALQRNFPALAARLGVAFAGSTPVTLNGTFAVDGMPLTTYSYRVGHLRVAGKAVLIGCPNYWVNPYVSTSVGAGFNSSTGFSTGTPVYISIIGTPTLVPFGFDSNTTTALSYTVGTGLNFKLNSNWEVGVGYEFASWGKSQLSRTPTVSDVVHMPELNNIYTHELQLSLSFLY
jgi:hypothetical protein